jgi:hypothetical protein
MFLNVKPLVSRSKTYLESATPIQPMVYTNLMIMDEYLPGIQAVLADEVSPVEAIRAIESTDTESQPIEHL